MPSSPPPDGLPEAVLLDRDGTINVKAPEGEYVTGPGQVRLLPGAAAAIRRLNEAGIPIAVVTNQRGIALGRMTEGDLEAVHARLDELLAREGARVGAYEHCPHDKGLCDCRKPGTAMLERARARLGLRSLAGSWMVGDAPTDVEAGRRAGARTIRLGEDADGDGDGADHVAASLDAAVAWLLGPTSGCGRRGRAR